MKIQLQFKSKPIKNFIELIKCYPSNEFASITRSTVPSLLYWVEGQKRLETLSKELGYNAPLEVKMDFEHQVYPPKGKGFPSCTDVMISWEGVVVGIEAKYTEGPYDSVEKWIKKGKDESNRILVLEGWLELVKNRTGKSIEISEISKVPYQMVHRLASVCSKKEKNAVLLYQVFNPVQKMENYYRSHLSKIKEILGRNDSIKVVLSLISFDTKSFEEI